jgi:hypothetical protein
MWNYLGFITHLICYTSCCEVTLNRKWNWRRFRTDVSDSDLGLTSLQLRHASAVWKFGYINVLSLRTDFTLQHHSAQLRLLSSDYISGYSRVKRNKREADDSYRASDVVKTAYSSTPTSRCVFTAGYLMRSTGITSLFCLLSVIKPRETISFKKWTLYL